jgi:hypothetical protein
VKVVKIDRVEDLEVLGEIGRKRIMGSKRIICIIISLLVLSSLSAVNCSQRPAQSPSTSVMSLEGTKVTVKGKIGYMERLGAYIIRGEDPPDELFVVNQNPKLLEELMKSGKTVIIDGHYTIGADHLFIEKIDGQAYRGKE